jgi:hypothetical protein
MALAIENASFGTEFLVEVSERDGNVAHVCSSFVVAAFGAPDDFQCRRCSPRAQYVVAHGRSKIFECRVFSPRTDTESGRADA